MTGMLDLFIAKAYASAPTAPTPVVPAGATPAVSQTPSFINLAIWVAGLVVLYYVLLIMPQQKRFKKHRAVIDSMKKGDKILTAGGLLGTIESSEPGAKEVVIDLGNGLKVTALRSTIQSRAEDPAATSK